MEHIPDFLEYKPDFSKSSMEINDLLTNKLYSLSEKGLDLNIKGLNYVEYIKKSIGLLQGINSEYYSQEDLKILIETRKMVFKLIEELEKHTYAKEKVYF